MAHRAAHLSLRNKDSNRLVPSRRERKVQHPLHAQLIPDSRQVLALEELDLVGDDARAQFLIRRVLQVPAGLRLLDEPAHNRMFISIAFDHAPDLEILHGVAVGVFRRTLPGDQVGSERREAQFENIIGRDGRNNVPSGGINDCHTIKHASQ